MTSVIAVVGEALVDVVESRDGAVTERLGGAPFNAARAAARLGADVEFVGAISTDDRGRRLRVALGADGVGLELAETVEAPTTLAHASLGRDGAATYTFEIAGTSAPAFVGAERLVDALGRTAGPIVVSGGLALVLEPLAGTLVSVLAARCPDWLVVIDVNCRPAVVEDHAAFVATVERAVAHADVVKVSDDDLHVLGARFEPTALLRRGAQVVLETRGGAGTVVHAGDRRVERPLAAAVPVVDTIGAGDSFVGAFCAWWQLSGFARPELTDVDRVVRAVDAAQVAASVVVGRHGADPPHRADLHPNWL